MIWVIDATIWIVGKMVWIVNATKSIVDAMIKFAKVSVFNTEQ